MLYELKHLDHSPKTILNSYATFSSLSSSRDVKEIAELQNLDTLDLEFTEGNAVFLIHSSS